MSGVAPKCSAANIFSCLAPCRTESFNEDQQYPVTKRQACSSSMNFRSGGTTGIRPSPCNRFDDNGVISAAGN
jgi:hypothetical protein